MPFAAEHLSDPTDPRLTPYRALRDSDLAREQSLFLVEGRFAVQTLLEGSRFRPHSILLHEAAFHAMQPILERSLTHQIPVFVMPRDAMEQLVGFDMHRGCIAAAHRPADLSVMSVLDAIRAAPPAQPIVILEDLVNHDNIGGIFRSAAAFGASAVLCSPRTADPLYRKAVRVSMAAVLRVPFGVINDWPGQLATLIEQERWSPFALSITPDAASIEALPALAAQAVTAGRRPALLIGAEGPGLSARALSLAAACLRIPMTDAVDSLNATVAASIALHRLAGAIP